MTPDTIPIYLQYGALGILAAVLVGVGYWLTWYAKEQQKFIRDLVDKRDVDAKEERADWKELIRSSTEAQVSTVAALSQIAQKLESSNSSHQRRHDEILSKLGR